MPIPMKDMSSFWPAAKVDSSPLRISEVMSANVTTLTDDYGAYSDYVEIETPATAKSICLAMGFPISRTKP